MSYFLVPQIRLEQPQDRMKDCLRRESAVDIQEDGDPYWFNNPQYRLSADENVEVGRFPFIIQGRPDGGRHIYL